MPSSQTISNALSAPVMAGLSVAVFSFFSPMGLGDIGPMTSIFLGMLFLVILPTAPILLHAQKGHVDFDVSDQRRRPFYFALAIGSYIASVVIFYALDSHVMFVLSMAYVTVTSVVSSISLLWKISVHAAGTAGPVTAMMWVFGPWVGFLHVTTLIALVARYRLRAHTLPQLAGGVIVSIAVTSLVYWLLL